MTFDAKRMLGRLPRAELVVLQGAGHNDIWDKKETLERALRFGGAVDP